jgi:hypothetical protein
LRIHVIADREEVAVDSRVLKARHGAGAAVALLGGVAAALMLHAFSPAPSADVSRGGEDALVRGLHPRELPPRAAPLRWTRESAVATFRFLPRGPATLDVEVRGHRGPVAVAVDGVIAGVIAPGATQASFALPASGERSREVELRTAPFRAGDGRALGTQLRLLRLRSDRRGAPPIALVLLLAFTAVALFAGAWAAGGGPVASVLLSLGVTAALTALLWPRGIVRSSYVFAAAGGTIAWAGLAALVVRAMRRRWPAIGFVAYAGLLAACVVQGLAATSPVMVVSDAVFHANNLGKVAAGDLWITSNTQHSPPFRFPYGVTFYALLAPLARAGLDLVLLVRLAAAAAGMAGSLALLWLMAPRGDPRAGLAVAALQLLPVTFELFSFGNLSNVFGQALTAVFFAWWAAGGPGGGAVGALLLAAGATAHFSSFVVLAALGAALLVAARRDGERWRIAAVAGGLGLAAAYYARFVPLIASQLPRLWHGSGGPGAGGEGAGPLLALLGQWGFPAIVLAVAGRPWPALDRLDRALVAYWAAGAALLVVALLSPLDVRYGHALGLPLAVAAAEGAHRLWSRGPAARLGVLALALAQGLLAGWNVVEAVLWRYRV